jgi:hypothetical protein
MRQQEVEVLDLSFVTRALADLNPPWIRDRRKLLQIHRRIC